MAKDLLKNYIYECLLFLVFLFALFFRLYTDTYHLLIVPDYDGYYYLKIAKNILKAKLVYEAVNWTPLLPVLIALFSFLPMPLDQLGSLINIFFGALTVFPIFFLVKNMLNKEAAFFSTIIYAFHPHIAFVNVQVMSESTYIFVFFILAWLMVTIIKTGGYSVKNGLVCGAVGALVYYGRPEGTITLIVLVILALIVGKVEFKTKIKWALITSFVILVVLLPYLFFLKSHTGKFVLSGKSPEILYHIRNMMGVPETCESYFSTFTYDLDKTYSFIKNNIINAWIITTEETLLYSVFIILFLTFFIIVIRKSTIGFANSLFFFFALILPVIGPIIFKVDQRYLSPTTSVLSVMMGIGLYGIFDKVMSGLRSIFIKTAVCGAIILFFTAFGFYKIYDRFERQGELQIIFEQERLYKKTGQWLAKHVPQNSIVVSTSPNYLVAYYANDMAFENTSKDLTEDELMSIVCEKPNKYLVIDYYSISRYLKRLPYLMNPYTQPFKTSKLYGKLIPIYYDDIAQVVVYSCNDGDN